MVKKGVWEVKLVQLNMWAGRLDRQISAFLSAEKPDLICLQEAISFERRDAGMFLSVENIQALLDMPYSVLAPVFSFRLMNGVAKFGNAIVSLIPIQKSEVVFTHLEHKDDFDFNEHNANARNFVHAAIKVNGKIINVITHHGYHIKEHKNGDTETLRQMKILSEYIGSLNDGIIVTGDFNLVPQSKSLEQINQKLTNLSATHKLKTTRTHLTHKTEVCDYIFVNDKIKVRSFTASDELISDHKALILEFDA